MSEESYKTVSRKTESEFKDRGSKFIGYALPVNSADEVKSALELIKSEHPSSRHVCYAFIIGTKGDDYRANDDGEPNGSAGLSILNQIKSFELTYTLVAVVRYFGGTKLGVSGLINAYKEAAKLALNKAVIVTKVPMQQIVCEFPHTSIGDVERLSRMHQIDISTKLFDTNCKWSFSVPIQDTKQTQDILSRVDGLIIKS